MEAKIDPAIRDPDLRAKIDQANGQLQKILGRKAGRVRVDWSLEPNGADRPAVALRLSDETSSIQGTLAPGELADPDQVYWRLHRLWGDLAFQTSEILVQHLVQHANDLDEE